MINNRKVVALIPARAGSVGIRDKNLKLFNGLPLFVWSILAAQQSKYVDKIVVSSNYIAIARIASIYLDISNIEFLKRPEYLCTGDSTTEECMLHTLKSLQDKYDFIITLQPTSPIREKIMIDAALEAMITKDKLTCMSVQASTPFFIQNQSDGLKWHYDPQNRKMRQQLTEDEMFFHDDGGLYITNVETLSKTKCRLDKDPLLYINNEFSSYQIDSENDWLILENILKVINKDAFVMPELRSHGACDSNSGNRQYSPRPNGARQEFN